MTDADARSPFFLIVVDYDRRVFTVEGPMTDDSPWNLVAGLARETVRRIMCGPSGLDRQTLAAEYQDSKQLGGAPPGSIVRPHQ